MPYDPVRFWNLPAAAVAPARVRRPPTLRLSGANALALEVDLPGGAGARRYPVAQFTAAWAVNQVPRAQCVLAVGRDAAGNRPSPVHVDPPQAGTPAARVLARFAGDAGPRGERWPERTVTLFEGRLVGGFRPRKVAGRVVLAAALTHWLGDLAAVSGVTANGAVTNPAALNAAALLSAGGSATAAGSVLTPVGVALGATAELAALAPDDLWGAVKTLFARLCGGGDARVVLGGLTLTARNAQALAALARVEGPGANGTAAAYRYGRPLALAGPARPAPVAEAVCGLIADAAFGSYAGATLWEKLVRELAPTFGLAVCPQVAGAAVLPDAPYRAAPGGAVWRTIGPDEYDAEDYPPDGARPVQGVGVYLNPVSQTVAGLRPPEDAPPDVLGAFAPTADDGGDVLFVPPPPWLARAAAGAGTAQRTTGAASGQPGRALAADAPGVPPPPAAAPADLVALAAGYARDTYLRHTLGGRVGPVGGRLRFDIAPGSLVRVRGQGERHLAGADDLAVDRVGWVTRVTVTVNAAGPAAGTAFDLAYVRGGAEVADPRYGWDGHPLFAPAGGLDAPLGLPLVPELEFPP